MASEMRLIDVNPFMKAGWHLVRTGKSNEYLASLSLADVPTVDAVEVVRCGKCDSHEKEACPKGTVWCKTMCRYMKPDGFCSEGKRSVEG